MTKAETRELSYVDAGVEALREEMERDESLIYIGQGIGPRGGNFRQTRGLWQKFGDHRLRDTGICELGATGVAIGASMTGSRVVVDEVFLDFSLEAMTQIVQQAATVHYVSNGTINAKIVIRGAMGSVRSAGAHHAHSFYSWYANTPGLKVCVPASPYDVKGLLKTSIRDDNPVVFVEHKALYNTKGPVPDEEYTIPFGKARICREGKDITLVAVGHMVLTALEAAASLEQTGISVEVLDPRTITPLDREALKQSIARTGRLLVVDEGPAFCGFSGEVFAVACEESFDSLDGPPRRLCSLPVPNPFSPVLENEMIPTAAKVALTIQQMVES
jgi:pyruvate/2-oxoglutarate/acetoin dehydrogenase E1 component